MSSIKTRNIIGCLPNWERIEELVANKYITKRPHPDDPSLCIYNYTAKTQYEGLWNVDTMMCRGLIARNERVVARPFQKFFNASELPSEYLQGPWRVAEKMDGSLGIIYQFTEGDFRVSSRGSFDSDQAIWATDWLKQNHPDFTIPMGVAVCVEIIYPQNRIVVDYGNKEGLIFLAALKTSGVEIALSHPLEYAKDYGTRDDMPKDERSNAEGYVLVNSAGFRVKVKHEEYTRLHKTISNCNNRFVWELLKNGDCFTSVLEAIPDEFHQWLREVSQALLLQHLLITSRIDHLYNEAPEGDRKDIAMFFKSVEFTKILFARLDGKDWKNMIWDEIKPEEITKPVF